MAKINQWYKTWWGIPLIMVILIFFIMLFFLLTKNCSCPECPKVELTEKCTKCPKLDCTTCPIKTETVVETKTTTEKIFVCEDLTEVKNKEDCVDFTEDGWYEVKTITANSSKTSELFYIPGDTWRFTWECKYSNFGGLDEDYSIMSLMFYEEGQDSDDIFESPKASVLNNKCVNGETSYVYSGKSNFFLKIQGANFKNLEVKIEAKK